MQPTAMVTLALAFVGVGRVAAAPTTTTTTTASNHTCVTMSCVTTCNFSATVPCCLGVGRCEWDPVFADYRCIPPPPLICGARRTPYGPPQALASQPVAVPSAQQLAWLDMEIGAMIGFNLQSICAPKGGPTPVTPQRCQASSRTEGALYVPTEDAVRAWDLSDLDTDAWVAVATSFGAKYIVLVADHMTGFTLWDTKYHNYSVANTLYKGGGGDVVKDLIASCKKAGIGLGFFYSVHFNWFLGVDGFKVGHPPLGPRTYTQEEYLAIAKGQLQEVIDLFGAEGPLEVWFDGGTGPSASEVGPTVMAAAPLAVCHSCDNNFTRGGPVRWMGNEEGMMPLPSWGATGGFGGNPLGPYFEPPSTDIVLREHYWFYQNDTVQTTKTVQTLVSNYLTSVGRASNVILNIAPNGTGAVPAPDATRYAEMGAAIKCLFSKSLGRSTAPMTMDATSGIMGPPLTFAPLPAIAAGSVSVVVRELQTSGQLIGNYSFECQFHNGTADQWYQCPMGELSGSIGPCHPSATTGGECIYTGVGHKRVLLFGAMGAGLTAVRMVVHSHFATGTQVPTLRDVELFDWSGAKACGAP